MTDAGQEIENVRRNTELNVLTDTLSNAGIWPQLVEWFSSHLRVMLGIGQAVDSPLSFVASYSRTQQTYRSRICLEHLSGEYVFLFKHVCKSQAVPNDRLGLAR